MHRKSASIPMPFSPRSGTTRPVLSLSDVRARYDVPSDGPNRSIRFITRDKERRLMKVIWSLDEAVASVGQELGASEWKRVRPDAV